MSEYDDSLWQSALAAQSGVNQLAGTIGEYKSQKERNELERELAYERNLWESEESEKAREFEREMWQSKIDYEDPSNKRKLLEEAGVNPYSLYGASISTPSSGTPTHNPMQSPNLVTEDALGKGLQNLAMNEISMVGAMSQARKNNADATATNIANISLGARLGAQLQGAGLDNAAKALDNELHGSLNPLLVEGQALQNEHTQSLIRLNNIQQKLQQFDLDWMKPSEYFKLQEDINLLLQKQKTEEELREHYKRMDRNGAIANAIGWFNANTERFAQQSQAGVNTALVKYYNAAAGKEGHHQFEEQKIYQKHT